MTAPDTSPARIPERRRRPRVAGALRRSVSAKLTIGALLASTLILGVVFTYNDLLSQRILLRVVQSYAQSLVSGGVHRVESVIRTVETFPEAIVAALESDRIEVDELVRLLPAMVESNPEVYGSTIAFEPGVYEGRSDYAPYFYMDDGTVVETTLAKPSNDYRNQEWYAGTLGRARSVWTEPYFDGGGGKVLMTTYAVPLMQGDHVQAVVTADISLDWLQDLVASIHIGEHGYVFLVSADGRLLAHPESELVVTDDARATASGVTRAYLDGIDLAWDAAHQEPQLLEHDPFIGGAARLLLRRSPSTGWSIGLVFSEDEMTAEMHELNVTVWTLGTLGTLLLLASLAWLANRMISPLRTLALSTSRLGRGELDVELPSLRSDDEIGSLSRAFVRMRDDLKGYIQRLTETVSAREKLENEVNIAQRIQLDMVPSDFPLFDPSLGVEVFASLAPARGVGGDLYDTFAIDDRHIFFAVGDVSGKGVPAALMMARTVTLIRGLARMHRDPARLLRAANAELARDNDSCMFVTMLAGVLDRVSGTVVLASAGHTLPLWLGAGGRTRFVELETEITLGLVPDAEFVSTELQLAPGDALVLYSDGVTEAMDPDEELFGERRLLELVRGLERGVPRDLVTGVCEAVTLHSAGAEQSDDIAVLALGWHPAGETRLRIQNEPAEQRRLQEALLELCDVHGLDDTARHDLRLILEEVTTNVIRCAYPESGSGWIDVALVCQADCFRIEVVDEGVPFDPLVHRAADISVALAERDCGGMGLLLIRELASELAYERRQGENRLVVEYTLG